MKKFLVLYNGPATPPDASHAGWPEWFEKTGSNVVSVGSPTTDRRSLHSNGSVSKQTTSLNGYCILQAADIEEAVNLLKDHPFLLGDEYTVEVFEIPR
jgi:hypothetical protein